MTHDLKVQELIYSEFEHLIHTEFLQSIEFIINIIFIDFNILNLSLLEYL